MSDVAAFDRGAQIAELGDRVVDVVRDARELSAKLAAARLSLPAILLHALPVSVCRIQGAFLCLRVLRSAIRDYDGAT